MARVRCLLMLLVLSVAHATAAQTFVRLQSTRVSDTLSSNGDAVTLTNTLVGGFGSVKVQTLDSYTGTWEVQCAADGTNFDTGTELKLTPTDSTTVAYSVSDTVGIWDVGNASACAAIRVIATAGFAATDTVVVISATQSGGGGSSGGGSGGDVTSNSQNIATETTVASIDSSMQTLLTRLGTDVVEDAAETAGGTGPMLLSVRRDTAASSAGTTGDNATVNTDAIGRLWTSGAVVEDVAEAGGDQLLAIASVRRDTAATSAGAAGDFATLNTDGLGRLWVRDGDPCSDHARISHAVISESTAATNEIVALNGSDLIYVCSYKWVTTAANSLSWTRGTGSDCGTGTTAIEGAQPYAANGGVTEQGGGHALFVVPAGNALCLVSSAATAHGGRVSYVRTAAP